MAIDVREMAATRQIPRVQGDIDPSVMQKVTIIVGGALVLLVALKLGFLQRVLP